MAFQIKDFASIAASCINWMRSTQQKITDFSVGSVGRTLVEAPAIEIEELYLRMLIGIKEAIPVAIYRSFDFTKLAATPASGLIRVTITAQASEVIIPANTQFTPDGFSVTFASQVDVIIPPGTTQADISVLASSSGVMGNVKSGTSFTTTQNISGFVSAVSLYTFSSGSDAETDEQQKIRFTAYIATLNRGTLAALRYGLSLSNVLDASGNVAERVRYSRIVEPWLDDSSQPVALVKAYIHNGDTGASSSLLARTQEVIDGYYDEAGNPISGWKAAGVKVEVIAATTSYVAVTGQLSISQFGYQSSDVIAQVEAAIGEYIGQLDVGADVIVSEIIAAAMGIDGVTNFILSAPTADVTIAETAKAMPGTLTITVS